MGSCGGSNESQSTEFARKGTTSARESRTLPSFLTSLLQSTANASGPHPITSSMGYEFLRDLLAVPAEDSITDPGAMDNLIAFPGSDYPGKATLASIAGQNPYSDEFAAGFDDFFTSAFDEAAAAGATGPDAVRGGASRGEFFKADMMEKAALNKTRELASVQQRQAELGTSAANTAFAIEGGQRSQAAAAQDQKMKQILQGQSQRLAAVDAIARQKTVNGEMLAAISNLMSTRNQEGVEDTAGKGAQVGNSFNWGAGVNCCFIFNQALNGELPWYVRKGRDLMCTPQRKLGYTRMAVRLVPAMRRSRVVAWLVNEIMVRPFLACGKWFFTGRGKGWLVRPLCEAWFRVWDCLGKA